MPRTTPLSCSPHARLIGALMLCCAAPAVARASAGDDAAPPPSAVAPLSGADIVVTAEKRKSTVQSTPISMTAMTGDQMQARGITDLKGVIQDVPGISMRTAGPGQTELEMRGLASSGGSSPTVGFYLDEVPLSPPAASLNGKVVIDPGLYDLNRTEVLRGPQGTLYGSGSMGGTIKLITNEPKLDAFAGSYDLNVGATQGGSPSGGGDLMLNLPLVKDKLGLRLVASEKYTGGWIDRIVGGADFPLETNGACAPFYGCTRGNVDAASVSKVYHDVNWNRATSLRASLLYRPAERFSLSVTGMYQRTISGGYSEVDEGAARQAHYQPYDFAEPFADTFYMVNAVAKLDLDSVQVTSATSYWHRVEQQTMDATELVQNLLGLDFYSPIGFTERDTTRQVSQELRVASAGEGRFQWVAGFFYAGLLSTWEATDTAAAYAPLSVGGAEANPQGIVYASHNPYHMDQYAGFGEVSYKLTPSLKATAGLRYYNFQTHVDMFQQGIGTATGNATPTTETVVNSASGFNPRFNLSFIPNPRLTVYATVAKGFRPGGVSLPAPPQTCGNQPTTYNPDSVWSYEAGEKARLLGGRLTINADMYLMNWSGVQQNITPACGYPYTTNAGTARAYGPEIELSAQITPELTATFSGTQTTAKLTSVLPGTGLTVGQPILNIPGATLNGALAYTRQIGGISLTARLADTYVGRVYDIAYTTRRLDPYNTLDLRLLLAKGARKLTFYITNLTDTRAALTVNNTSFAWLTPSLTRVSVNQPRSFGISWANQF